MPIKFRSISASESLNQEHNAVDVQVAQSAEVLLRAIECMSGLAKPKTLTISNVYLQRFEQVPSDESRHAIRIDSPADEPVDEIAEWQIIGAVQGRIVNVIAHGVFHTYKHNRSGNRELFINGKSIYLKPELGGVSLNAIWQDSNR